MKKFLAITLVTFLLLTFSVTTFAEVESSAEEIVTEEVSVVEDTSVAEENTSLKDKIYSLDITVEDIMSWIENNYDKISVVVTLLFSVLFAIRRSKKINNAITTVNNNSVAIAKNSEDSMVGMSNTVTQYSDSMSAMLAEIRRNNEERASLEESLTEVSKYLKATRLANLELANEVAELLILANIPNSKKDELYSRHLAAVNAISEAEKVVAEIEEVKENEETHEE